MAKLQYTYRSSATLSDETIEYIRSEVDKAGSFPRFVDRLVAADMAGKYSNGDSSLSGDTTAFHSSSDEASSNDKLAEQLSATRKDILAALNDLDVRSAGDATDVMPDLDEFREAIVSDISRLLSTNELDAEVENEKFMPAPVFEEEGSNNMSSGSVSEIIAAIEAAASRLKNEMISSSELENLAAGSYSSSRAESDTLELLAVKKEELRKLDAIIDRVDELDKHVRELMENQTSPDEDKLDEIIGSIDKIKEKMKPESFENLTETRRDAWTNQMEVAAGIGKDSDEKGESFSKEEKAVLDGANEKVVIQEEVIQEDKEETLAKDLESDYAADEEGKIDMTVFPTEDEEFTAGLMELVNDTEDDEENEEPVFIDQMRSAWKETVQGRSEDKTADADVLSGHLPEEASGSHAQDNDLVVGAAMLLLDD